MKVWNFHDGDTPESAVNIMRGTPWGNPFYVSRPGGRRGAIAKFERWLDSQPALVAKAKIELRDKDLMCCCAPKPCHGDVWMRIANL